MEKRESQRFPFSAKAIYEVSAHQNLLSRREKQGIRNKAQIQNISKRGICVSVSQVLHPSQIVMLHLPLSDSGIAIPTVAEVRWVRPDSAERMYEAGLRFLF